VEEVGGVPSGPFEDLEMIRQDAAMPVSRFAELIGIGRRTYHRWQANARRTGRAKGPWPAPVVDAVEPLAAKYADDWPGWGHRKIYAADARRRPHRLGIQCAARDAPAWSATAD
jgi:putative transposase